MRTKRLRKKSQRQRLIERADAEVRRILLVRDVVCQHCGKRHPNPRAIVTSHVLPKSRYPELRFDLLNVKLLCLYCHSCWWHRQPFEAAQWFMNKFPARWAYLEREKGRPCWRASDLPGIIQELSEKADQLGIEACNATKENELCAKS